jgi:hypothetical protein
MRPERSPSIQCSRRPVEYKGIATRILWSKRNVGLNQRTQEVKFKENVSRKCENPVHLYDCSLKNEAHMAAKGRTDPVCLRTGHFLNTISDQSTNLSSAVLSNPGDERMYPAPKLQRTPTIRTSRVYIVVLIELWQINLKAVGQLNQGSDFFKLNR